MIDPMHGNTFNSTLYDYKTRNFSSILEEMQTITTILLSNQEFLSGIHLESSFENVTEVCGGKTFQLNEEDLIKNYKSGCDPRLNTFQTIDLIHDFGNFLRKF